MTSTLLDPAVGAAWGGEAHKNRPAAPACQWLILTLSLLLFVALSAPQLSRPFVGDEVDFVKTATALVERGSHEYDRGFIDDLIETTQYQKWTYHPPLYLWCLGGVFQVFGASEVSARGFGVACGLASLLLTFGIAQLTGAKDAREPVAALAVLLCAVNPFFIQSCLLIDIDGTVYTTLILFLVYLALRLEGQPQPVRATVLTLVFMLALACKMTTALAFPVALGLYHLLRRQRSRALVDVLCIGAGGAALFAVAYWTYAWAMGLDYIGLFLHINRSDAGLGFWNSVMKLLIFSSPVLPVLLLRGLDRPSALKWLPVLALLALVAGTYHFGVRAGATAVGPLLTSYALIMVPFSTPGLLVLMYLALLQGVKRWLAGGAEGVDLVILLGAAIVVSYVGVMTRGAVFSLYHAPAVPLMAVAATNLLSRTVPRPDSPRLLAPSFYAVAVIAVVYGLFVLGDSYFLTKRGLLEIREWSVFAAVARWWNQGHAHDPAVAGQLKSYFGYQSYFLGVVWYVLALLPIAVFAALARRPVVRIRLRPAAGLIALAIGLGLGLSVTQCLAGYQTTVAYGYDSRAAKEMAAIINAEVPMTGYYLAPREVGYYVRHPGFIDATRYQGGYKRRTQPSLNERGELVLLVDESGGYPDALPRGPIHFLVGGPSCTYGLVENAPRYHIGKQVGSFKLYQFIDLEPERMSR